MENVTFEYCVINEKLTHSGAQDFFYPRLLLQVFMCP